MEIKIHDFRRDPVRKRLIYLPIEEVAAGMVLGEGFELTRESLLLYTLPEGHLLTEDNIRELTVYHADFVCVLQEDLRSEAQIEADRAAAVAGVRQVFSKADLSIPCLAGLYNRLLEYRGNR